MSPGGSDHPGSSLGTTSLPDDSQMLPFLMKKQFEIEDFGDLRTEQETSGRDLSLGGDKA